MKAVVLEAPDDFGLRDVPEPSTEGSLLRVISGGICGTDRKVVSGQMPAKLPVILGHEIVGEVIAPAPGSTLSPGTRAVIDPSIWCGVCDVCRRDLPHLCPGGGLIGRDADGGFAEYITAPDARLHALPVGMSVEDMTMIQVLSTCVHGQSLLKSDIGQTALVVGLGVAGLLHVQLLAARGVRTIIGVGRSAGKLELARTMGASIAVTPDEAIAAVNDLTLGRGVDIAIDCVGTRDALVQAMSAAGLGASVLLYGLVPPPADGMPTYDWYKKELTLVNTRAARPRDITAAICAVRDGLVSPGRLITSAYSLGDVHEAIAASARSDQVKVILTISA